MPPEPEPSASGAGRQIPQRRGKASSQSVLDASSREGRPGGVQRSKSSSSSRGVKPPGNGSDVSSSPSSELLDLLMLLPPLLATPLHPNSPYIALLASPPLSSLPRLLPQLAPLVSAQLYAAALALARVASPATNPSFLHRTLASSLPVAAAELRDRLDALTHNNAPVVVVAATGSAAPAAAAPSSAARRELTRELQSLLEGQAAALGGFVRALEARHGGVARSAESRAAVGALVARRAEAEAELLVWQARRDVVLGGGGGGGGTTGGGGGGGGLEGTGMAETGRALRRYREELQARRREVEELVRGLRERLAEYGVDLDGGEGEGGGGNAAAGQAGRRDYYQVQARKKEASARERTMREMARVKREMETQIDEATRDLERLKTRR